VLDGSYLSYLVILDVNILSLEGVELVQFVRIFEYLGAARLGQGRERRLISDHTLLSLVSRLRRDLRRRLRLLCPGTADFRSVGWQILSVLNCFKAELALLQDGHLLET